jgi:uncharacterized protein YuzE
MGTITLEKSKTEAELIKSAKLRVKSFPTQWIKLYYSDEVDSLFVQVSKEKIAVSKHDFEDDVVYNYNEKGQVVSFEILDLFEIFETA